MSYSLPSKKKYIYYAEEVDKHVDIILDELDFIKIDVQG